MRSKKKKKKYGDTQLLQGRIQELKGGGAEVKYLQREIFTLRHSHFGVIWL